MRKSSNDSQKEKWAYQAPTITVALIELENVILAGSTVSRSADTSLEGYENDDADTSVDGLNENGDYAL
ncbi:MAG: hypothetical protein LBN24_01430 [Mediterranea sp.]|jgi:hypothetical protein|nr:hypothetical protein [Mediterranea sp.]